MEILINTVSNKSNTKKVNLRVLSYNIHKGFSPSNKQFLLKKIRQAIHLVDADIVFLQEVVGENKTNAASISNWTPNSQFEFLADSVWHHHAYGKNSVYTHGHHGNAILSRYPLHSSQNIDISIIPYSRRGVLHTKTFEKLHLFCTHFGLLSMERKAQLKKVVPMVRRCVDSTDAIIMAGDFNDWRNYFGQHLEKELNLKEVLSEIYGKPKATFPAYSPLLPMDRIYFRGLDLVDAKVLRGSPWNQLSDHCAVYAEFSYQ